MRVRASLMGAGSAQLDRFNRRHPWSHNDHFHGWILRQLPDRRGVALEVGCGRGELLAKLAERFARVDGIDADTEMALASSERCASTPTVRVRQLPFDAATGSYDLITMVAVLHHLDLEAALRQARNMLAGGGRLLVVGLARPATAADLAWEIASALLNPLVGVVKHPRVAIGNVAAQFPLVDPSMTFDEVRAQAMALLPGARMRRRLFFRYTLEWTKPAS
jgi:SAM-dependent methyltransferase